MNRNAEKNQSTQYMYILRLTACLFRLKRRNVHLYAPNHVMEHDIAGRNIMNSVVFAFLRVFKKPTKQFLNLNYQK